MNKLIFFAVCVTAGFFAAWLFYYHPVGINLLVYELPLLAYLLYFNRRHFRQPSFLFVFSGFLFTLCAVVVVNSSLAVCVHWLFFVLVAGSLSGISIKSPHYMLGAGIEKLPFVFTLPFRNPRAEENRDIKILKPFYIFRLSVIPLLLILFFMLLYAWAVPKFGNLLLEWISNWPEINIRRAGIFILGMFGAAFLLYKAKNSFFETAGKNSSDVISRTKNKYFAKGLGQGLKNETFSITILLAGLNVLLFYVNALDMGTYWFSYRPESYESMKQLVHSGTYVLIFCILLSIFITLYIFRGNINFYSKNKWIKGLAVAWLAQNAVMVLSVAWRNYWYIQHYNLAYKRIAVLLFLTATVFGIITTIIKTRSKKSSYYLLRINGLYILFILAASSFVNWDRLIASYNLDHKESAVVHKNFLMTLDNSALPVLLEHKDFFNSLIEYEPEYRRFLSRYPEAVTYNDIIQAKLAAYKSEQAARKWPGWNARDYYTMKAVE